MSYRAQRYALDTDRTRDTVNDELQESGVFDQSASETCKGFPIRALGFSQSVRKLLLSGIIPCGEDANFIWGSHKAIGATPKCDDLQGYGFSRFHENATTIGGLFGHFHGEIVHILS